MKVLNAVRGSWQVENYGVQSDMIHLAGMEDIVQNATGKSARATANGIFVNNISVSLAEKSSVIQCFDDFNYVFAFGHSPTSSIYTVDISVFLAKSDCTGLTWKGGKYVVDWYERNRVSSSKNLAYILLKGDGTQTFFKGVVIGLQINGQSAENNILNMKITILGIQGLKPRT